MSDLSSQLQESNRFHQRTPTCVLNTGPERQYDWYVTVLERCNGDDFVNLRADSLLDRPCYYSNIRDSSYSVVKDPYRYVARDYRKNIWRRGNIIRSDYDTDPRTFMERSVDPFTCIRYESIAR